MANVETRHNEYTFLGSGYSMCEHIFYEQRLDYVSILSRSGRATAHDVEEPPSASNVLNERGRISVVLSYLLLKKEGDAEREPRFRIIRSGKGWDCSDRDILINYKLMTRTNRRARVLPARRHKFTSRTLGDVHTRFILRLAKWNAYCAHRRDTVVVSWQL